MLFSKVATFLSFVSVVFGDCYMHNPRGSNNRLNEQNANTNNANRLFDSQNNNAGGYCYGPALSYYEGSELSIEWTNQHSCNGEDKTECQIVLQYMCSDSSSNGDPDYQVRDGSTTETIPTDENTYNMMDSLGVGYIYGMHEDYYYYEACSTRERQQGLFIADRNINGNSARFTRQNNNGQRRGFECPEERDYYPYWHPTPWKDIAILTSNINNCAYYRDNSQNNGDLELGWCEDSDGNVAPQNYASKCMEEGNEWKTWSGHDSREVDCVEAPWSRSNHLGNGVQKGRYLGEEIKGHAQMYNWTLPWSQEEPCIDTESCSCVVRIRYNMTTNLDGFAVGGMLGESEYHDSTHNGDNSPLQNDPYFEAAGATFALEINTDQYGRTFQDRSFVFHILKRPLGVTDAAKIWNLNVRGKRGNIVQVYPSVEYDFVPTYLEVRQFDFVHFQWTGCDTNPNGRAGQGRETTDRSNIVQIADMSKAMPVTEGEFESGDVIPMFESSELRNWMANLGQKDCLSMEEVEALEDDEAEEDINNCFELNAAEPHFNGGLIQQNRTGDFYFMSTRNNNFSNRSQKGNLKVQIALPPLALAAVIIVGALALVGGGAGAAFLYAKSHPHGALASKMPEFLSSKF